MDISLTREEELMTFYLNPGENIKILNASL